MTRLALAVHLYRLQDTYSDVCGFHVKCTHVVEQIRLNFARLGETLFLVETPRKLLKILWLHQAVQISIELLIVACVNLQQAKWRRVIDAPHGLDSDRIPKELELRHLVI